MTAAEFFAMKPISLRPFVLSCAVCVLTFAFSALLPAADPAPKTDESGWVLPGANVGTGWHLRLKDARTEASKENKPILIVFSGPDWSSASKKFESSVLKSKEFSSSVRPVVVGLYIQHFVNTSAPEEQVSANQSLRKALAVPTVYPCTVVLASDGKKILGIIPGAPDKKDFIRQIGKLTGIEIQQ